MKKLKPAERTTIVKDFVSKMVVRSPESSCTISEIYDELCKQVPSMRGSVKMAATANRTITALLEVYKGRTVRGMKLLTANPSFDNGIALASSDSDNLKTALAHAIEQGKLPRAYKWAWVTLEYDVSHNESIAAGWSTGLTPVLVSQLPYVFEENKVCEYTDVTNSNMHDYRGACTSLLEEALPSSVTPMSKGSIASVASIRVIRHNHVDYSSPDIPKLVLYTSGKGVKYVQVAGTPLGDYPMLKDILADDSEPTSDVVKETSALFDSILSDHIVYQETFKPAEHITDQMGALDIDNLEDWSHLEDKPLIPPTFFTDRKAVIPPPPPSTVEPSVGLDKLVLDRPSDNR